MIQMVEDTPTRRDFLSGTLSMSVLALAGCASSRQYALGPPAPAWPAQRRPGADPYPTRREPVAIDLPVPTSSPQVMPRSAWTREQPTLALANRMGRIERITIHHDAMDAAGFSTADQARQRLSDIRRAHTDNGWADIGYHYVIDPTGVIWSARPVQLQGAHVRDWNEHNLGIMLMGNFMHDRPTPRALTSLRALVRSESARYRVPAGRISTHRELASTACPGDSLQREVDVARSQRVAGFA
jgi:hypothetical protein